MGLSDRVPGMKPGSRIRNIAVAVGWLFVLSLVAGALAGPPADDGSGANASSLSNAATETVSATATQAPTRTATATMTATATATPKQTTSATPTATATETQTPVQTSIGGSSGGDLAVRVIYDGEWAGAIGSDGNSQSVDGSGTETIDVSDDAFVVSANAQKQDDSDKELTIQILRGDTVIAEQSTTAAYGVAQVAERV